MGCYCQYCPCQEACPAFTEDEIQRSMRKRGQDELRKQYIEEEGYNVIEIYESDWWKKYKTDKVDEQHLREASLYKMPPRELRFLENIKSGSLFDYV